MSRPVWKLVGSLERVEVRERERPPDEPDGRPKGNMEGAKTSGT